MRKEFVIGAVLLGGTLLAWLVLPAIVTSDARQAEAATRQATEAAHDLAAYSPGLAHRVDEDTLSQLKEADLQRLVDEAAASAEKQAAATKPPAEGDKPADAGAETPVSSFAAMTQQQTKEADAARNADQRLDLPMGRYPTVSATGAGLKQAVDQVIALRKQNDTILSDAIKKAKAAHAEGRDVLGVAQVLGNAQFIQAASSYIDATEKRTALRRLHGQLIERVARLGAAKAEVDYYATLSSDDISKGLATDLEDLRSQSTAATSKAEELDAAVAEREKALTQAQADMKTAREELTAIETRSFKAGDDAAFATFKKTYSEAAERLRKLQEREQELASGGKQNANLPDDALETGEITGGTLIAGLDELKRQQQIARIRADRLRAGVTSLERALANAQEAAAGAAKMRGEAQKREEALKGELAALLKSVNTAADQAFKAEDAAAATAKEALTAFQESEKTGQAFVNAGSAQQRDSDPNGTNERLRAISQDHLASAVGTSGAAETQMLIGRVQAGRYAGLTEHIDALETYAKAAGGADFNAGELKTKADDARETAIRVVGEAATKFEQLAKGSSANNWTALASLAAAKHLLSLVDTKQEAVHKTAAIDALKRALDKRDRHPLVATHVLFRAHLTGEAPPEPGQSSTPPPAAEGEGEKKPADGATPPPPG